MPVPIPRPQIVQVADGSLTTAPWPLRSDGWADRRHRIDRQRADVWQRRREVVATPALGDETFIYQIDDGAPYKAAPYNGPYVGRVYTSIQVARVT